MAGIEQFLERAPFPSSTSAEDFLDFLGVSDPNELSSMGLDQFEELPGAVEHSLKIDQLQRHSLHKYECRWVATQEGETYRLKERFHSFGETREEAILGALFTFWELTTLRMRSPKT